MSSYRYTLTKSKLRLILLMHKAFNFIDIEYWKHNGVSSTFEFISIERPYSRGV